MRDKGLRVEGEMVNVRSKRRAKRILLITGMLLMSVSDADAGLWGSRKATQAGRGSDRADDYAERGGDRRLARAPAHQRRTGLHLVQPAPGVFVVDLTGTAATRASSFRRTFLPPSNRSPPSEVTEMGSSSRA